MKIDRRDFLKLAGIGAAIFSSGLGRLGSYANAASGKDDFFFVQLSDTHWGFSNPAVNPDSAGTLKKAVASVNSLTDQPDFIMFTGDLTHVTDDDKDRRTRLSQFRDIISELKVKNIRFMPGEHDAGLDEGAVFKELFGNTHYTFDHKGVHFIVLDNVSDPASTLGEDQLQWLSADLKKLGKEARIVVFTHRPLFDLYTDWDWYTRDGAKAIELLKPYSNVTVLYGHIHQEHHHKTGNIAHHAAKGLMYPLPAPGSVPKKAPVPWDANQPYRGLGFRGVDMRAKQAALAIAEFGVKGEKL
ncbi:MAG TPA: metallophosphoesterase [Thermodesulfobacteriota bacterium]|nr:metallophosphoesterase [Thermodesulfobacteriota bacterium]